MPRKIVIHAGFHKTGTSTVQAVLRANRKALMPALAIRLKGQMKELMHATRGYSTFGTEEDLDKVRRRFDALLADLPGMPRRTLLLSAEELSGHMPGRGALATYKAAPVLMYLYWERAKAAFPKAPVSFVFSTRQADDWQRSAWAEHVKSSGMTLDYADYQTRYASAADLDGIVSEVTSRVPAPVHSYRLESCQPLPLGPADPLLDHCDVPADLRKTLTPLPPQNTRLSDETLAALLDINRTHSDTEARNRAKAQLLGEGSHS
ncbi:hypothetical protein [Sulfitobacter donghicola]|uniref:Sulfotransferase family protein n=1 Tax=Sulfitobacter donghicola DSW-25 = KCTC 12864 = JCM 14565 TaxID=1300350 RepID=A0A073IKV3_9RHOB|nr:hypothetical protein [Sulfitobacter donghicola]KEJ90958.1 hypothetical protein DSW25_03425 [Sulfitobacter donghicola DSW-25 = KCTC 12864 = JCM 14565]KIN68249.1 hypothetical protein Z948_1978 [Sulfitobacter donghicola DSW-25 = KCTC 12864 = JCM 14565]